MTVICGGRNPVWLWPRQVSLCERLRPLWIRRIRATASDSSLNTHHSLCISGECSSAWQPALAACDSFQGVFSLADRPGGGGRVIPIMQKMNDDSTSKRWGKHLLCFLFFIYLFNFHLLMCYWQASIGFCWLGQRLVRKTTKNRPFSP